MSIISNLKWNAISQSFKIISQLISMIYLARLIAPAEYGIMAMAAVITNFAILFRDLGTSAAIVQRDTINNKLKASVFWSNTILGTVVALIIISSAGFFSVFYAEPRLKNVLIILSLNFIFLGSSSLHLALLERDSQFKVISKIEIFAYSIALIAAIILAQKGFGVYSLVIQTIISTLLSSTLFWHFSPWRPKSISISVFSGIRNIFSFSYQLFTFNLINYFARNLDSFLIGKFMSPSILGAYNLAYRIMLFPLTTITFIVNRSLFPILSKKKHNYQEIEKIYLNTIYIIWFITIPVIVPLFTLNDMFITVIFGEKWHLASEILLWLAPTAIIQSVLSTTGTIFMSQGRTGILVLLGTLGAILTGVAFIFGVQENIVQLAKYYFIANLIHFFPCLILTMKVLKSDFIKVVIKTYPLFLAAILSYLATSIIKPSFNDNIMSLTIISIIGWLTFIIALTPTKEVKTLIKKITKKTN